MPGSGLPIDHLSTRQLRFTCPGVPFRVGAFAVFGRFPGRVTGLFRFFWRVWRNGDGRRPPLRSRQFDRRPALRPPASRIPPVRPARPPGRPGSPVARVREPEGPARPRSPAGWRSRKGLEADDVSHAGGSGASPPMGAGLNFTTRHGCDGLGAAGSGIRESCPRLILSFLIDMLHFPVACAACTRKVGFRIFSSFFSGVHSLDAPLFRHAGSKTR